MREILFRGKRIDNGEWVEGSLYFWENDFDGSSVTQICNCHSPWVEVDQATVGQYTGLKDKNGVRIFEHDIIFNANCFNCCSAWGGEPDEHPTKRIVIFDEPVFRMAYIQEKFREKGVSGLSFVSGNSDCFEVIGNIHDKEAE